ncbi:MAG: SdpI family protein [Chloroflexota bacterium]|nr:SdpI family protein [Chloroflexota bacterium]
MNNNQINLKRMGLISAFALAAMAALSAWAWPQLPADASIPVHWGLDGTPDRYGGKWEGLFGLPLVTLGITLLLTAILYIDPLHANIQRSGKAYTITWIVLLLFMAALHLFVVFAALGWVRKTNLLFSMGMGVVFLVIGNYMGKIRRNYTFGIKTPWTLASDRVWDKTHRLGGRVFMLAGLLILLGAFLPSGPLQLYLMLGSLIGATILVVLYSYAVWRNDPAVQVERG